MYKLTLYANIIESAVVWCVEGAELVKWSGQLHRLLQVASEVCRLVSVVVHIYIYISTIDIYV